MRLSFLVCVDGDGFVRVHYTMVDEGGCISTHRLLLQAGVRFNTFIVLVVGGAVCYGNDGFGVSGFGASVLIPAVNVFSGCRLWCLMHGPSSADGTAFSLVTRLVSGALIRNL